MAPHADDTKKPSQQHQSLSSIRQQIKGIGELPQSQRGSRLHSLAQQALAAAHDCDSQTEKQLLKLADFAQNQEAILLRGASS